MNLKSVVPKRVGLAVASFGLAAMLAAGAAGCVSSGTYNDMAAKYNESQAKLAQYQDKEQKDREKAELIGTIKTQIDTTLAAKDYATQKQVTDSYDKLSKQIDGVNSGVTDVKNNQAALAAKVGGLETKIDQHIQQTPQYPYPPTWPPSTSARWLSETRSYVIPQFTLQQAWGRIRYYDNYKTEFISVFGNGVFDFNTMLNGTPYDGEVSQIAVDNLANLATIYYTQTSYPQWTQQHSVSIDRFRVDNLLRNTLGGDYWTIFANAQK